MKVADSELTPNNGADKKGKCSKHFEPNAPPPPYEGETESTKSLYPALPSGDPPVHANPVSIVKYVTDVQGATTATTTYCTRNRTEMQELCKEMRIKAEETLAIWLGRLVTEVGSELLDKEEAAYLVRQANWRGGHITDLNPVQRNAHWNILLPALAARGLNCRGYFLHEGRPVTTTAKQICLAIIGVSNLQWDAARHPLGLQPAQQHGHWPHWFLQQPGLVPVTMEAVESSIEIYGGPQSITLRLLLNPLIGQAAAHVLSILPCLQAMMKPPAVQSAMEITDPPPLTSAYPMQPAGWKDNRRPSPSQPPIQQRTPEERAMFWFLLQESGMNKLQLRLLGDEGQWKLAKGLGFQYTKKPKNE